MQNAAKHYYYWIIIIILVLKGFCCKVSYILKVDFTSEWPSYGNVLREK